MPKLKFITNDFYLLYYALTRPYGRVPFPEWIKVTQRLKRQFPQGYHAMVNGLDSTWSAQLANISTPKDSSRWLHEREKEIEALLREGVAVSEFLRLREETKKHSQEVEEEWKEHGKKALAILQEIIRIPIPSKTIEIVMVHPKLCGGFYVGGAPPKIVWGHDQEWPFYHVVYLCHELLHMLMIPDWSKWNWKEIDANILHALIELATDNELRVRLHGKGRYFFINDKYIGHDHLKPMVERILPFWKRYLRNTKSDLLGLAKELTLSNKNGD